MKRYVLELVLFLAATLTLSMPVAAQPLQIVGMDPVYGPICVAGPLGPAPCNELQQAMAGQFPPAMGPGLPPLVQIGVDPVQGPICAGPLGPGPCAAVANYLAHQFSAPPPPVETRPPPDLTEIGYDPLYGPICAGPLGPGPCQAVAAYIAGLRIPQPFPTDLSQVTVKKATAGDGLEAMCSGPVGNEPCTMLQQRILDSGHLPTVPPLDQLDGMSAQDIAIQCAQRSGLDVIDFASCSGGQAILSPRQQSIVDCAVSNDSTEGFAACAAENSGVKLNSRQQALAGCAMSTNGDAETFADCAGRAVLSRQANKAIECASTADGDAEAFAECAAADLLGKNLSASQQEAIACAAAAHDGNDLAGCAADQLDLSDDQRQLVDCALESGGEQDSFLSCAGSSFLENRLGVGGDAALALDCAQQSSSSEDFASCAAVKILGKNASKEQQIALTCAAESGGDIEQAAVCAGANYFNMDMKLNPEQQIAVQCVVSTGGQPYAAAGCIATRLTARELVKCFTDGVGGDGCFGDNNDLFGKNGWTARTLGDIAGGPNSVVNNPDQIWGGDNSFIRNPDQIWGGDNSFVRHPEQIFGGDNSVFNNPGQLIPEVEAPKPIEVGTVGGHRVCIPWC